MADTSEGGDTFLHHPTTSDKPIDVSTLLDVNIGDKAEIEYYFDEMRRRQVSIVLLQGEDVLLLPRLKVGTRCPFWRSEEEQCSSPLDSRAKCYNTGWVGGYHTAITIKIVFPPANRTSVVYEEGVRKEYKPRPWTIHTPQIHERDLLIQRSSGLRYEVLDVSQITFRGLPMHQEIELRRLTPDKESFAYQVPVIGVT